MRITQPVTITATGNSPSYDHGSGYAPGSQGVITVAVINVTALVGTGTYTVAAQESADGVTWVTVSQVVTITAAKVWGVQFLSNLRYTRLAFTIGGTSPSITYEGWFNTNVGR